MASEHAVYPDDDLDEEEEPSSSDNDLDENDDVLNDEEDEELGEEFIISPSTSSQLPAISTPVTATAVSAIPTVPIAVPSATAVTIAAVANESGPDLKRQRISDAPVEKKQPPLQLDDSRRLFQRLWTDEDEIELLQGFLDYTAQRGNANSHHLDTALFYDQIKSRLQLDFNKNQLVEKLRRLKKKYRNVMAKISSGKEVSFKSPHDHATFEISRKIWSNELGKPGVVSVEDTVLDEDESNLGTATPIDDFGEKKTPKSRKRSRPNPKPGLKIDEKKPFVVNSSNNNGNVGNVDGIPAPGLNNGGNLGNIAGLVEDTVKSCLSPLFKELLGNSIGGGSYGMRGYIGLPMNAMPLHFGGGLSSGSRELVDERWRKQQILELEVYSKRLELVQDQIKAALDELRSI